MKALVMVASRDRPERLASMIESVRATSEADIAVYVDDDQAELYRPVIAASNGPKVCVGPRIGPCASLEHLAASHPGYDAYGAATDDCEFLTAGWDQWMLKQCRGVRMFSPNGTRMDFPWMSGVCMRALGSFVPTAKNTAGGTFYFRHYYWDVALEVLADSVGCLVRTAEEFVIRHHELDPSYTRAEQDFIIGADARALTMWAAFSRPVDIEQLRAAGI